MCEYEKKLGGGLKWNSITVFFLLSSIKNIAHFLRNGCQIIWYRIVLLKTRTVRLYMRYSQNISRGIRKKCGKDYDFATEIDTKGKKNL